MNELPKIPTWYNPRSQSFSIFIIVLNKSGKASETRQNLASEVNMALLTNFRNNLKETLLHLYDPDFVPAEEIFRVLGFGSEASTGGVQSNIIHNIEKLKSDAEKHSGSRTDQSFSFKPGNGMLCTAYTVRDYLGTHSITHARRRRHQRPSGQR